jgi:hypothetical protein
MNKHISFSDTVSILNQAGTIQISTLSIKNSLTKNKNKSSKFKVKRAINNYKQQQAFDIGRRIAQEVKNKQLLSIRNKQELIVEKLLAHYKLYNTIHKVYRLSNNALNVLKNKLIYNT